MSEPEAKEEATLTLHVPAGYQGHERLDVYLTGFIQNATRAKVQRGIKDGRVTVNGAVVTKPSHTVLAGDEIVCRVLRAPPIEAIPEAIPLDIVYEDDDLLVVNKAAGMVVHPAYGHRSGTLVNALLGHVGADALRLDSEDDQGLDDEDLGLSTVQALPDEGAYPIFRPGIVHRLDKDTSGVMVVAKNDVAHAHLAQQFMERTIQRRYLAIVWGVPDPAEGRIEGAIGRDKRDRKKMAVVPDGQGKHAVTHYETVEAQTYTALLRFRLETGRTHQIRVHAQYIGHPVFGDPAYGGRTIRYGPKTGARRQFIHNLLAALPRQALHAHTLGFEHPRSGEALHFTAELPDDMQYVLDRLRSVEASPR